MFYPVSFCVTSFDFTENNDNALCCLTALGVIGENKAFGNAVNSIA